MSMSITECNKCLGQDSCKDCPHYLDDCDGNCANAPLTCECGGTFRDKIAGDVCDSCGMLKELEGN